MSLINFLNTDSLLIWLALTARFLGLCVFAPGLSSKSIPKKVKVILSGMLGIISLNFTNYIEINSLYTLMICIVCEALGGTLIGFVSNLFINVLQVIGTIIDSLLGTGMFQTASIQSISSVSSSLIEYTAIILFFLFNAHLYIIHLLIVKGNFLDLYPILINEGFLKFIVSILNYIFINGLSLSTPFILILLTIDLSLGIINRSFSTFNVFLFSIPIKMLLFVVVLNSYIFFFIENFPNLWNINLDLIYTFLNLFKI